MALDKKAFENIVGKAENAGSQAAFSLFLKYILVQ